MINWSKCTESGENNEWKSISCLIALYISSTCIAICSQALPFWKITMQQLSLRCSLSVLTPKTFTYFGISLTLHTYLISIMLLVDLGMWYLAAMYYVHSAELSNTLQGLNNDTMEKSMKKFKVNRFQFMESSFYNIF